IKSQPIPPLVAVHLVRIFRRLQALQPRVAANAEEIESVIREFPDMIPSASTETSPARALVRRANAARTERRRLQKEQAQHGAIAVKLVPKPRRYVLAEIDARPGVLLPPFVAALLAVLIADSGMTSDPFVGWKSIE